MPITPHFSLSQTDSHVVITISVPHVRVNLDSMHMALSESNHCLHWSCPPYLLRLTFQRPFAETAAEQAEAEIAARATYEPMIQDGALRLQLPKMEPGVLWTDLDLLGNLVPHRQSSAGNSSKWIQQVMATSESDKNESNDIHETTETAEMLPDGYGFLRLFHGIFTDWTRDGLAKEMYECPWPEEEKANEEEESSWLRKRRRQERRAMENEKFCGDRYFQDMECQDDYFYMCAMSMRPHWTQDPPRSQAPSNKENDNSELVEQFRNLSVTENIVFTESESEQLASIPYPLLPPPQMISLSQQHALLLGLLDILFAYVYDHLLTDGDPTVESAWTVSILSASLSWLDDWLDESDQCNDTSLLLDNVLCSSIRRCLIYPYIRNLYFSVRVWQHVARIFRSKRRCVIRCLLQVRSILHHSELYYLNNKLFIDFYLAWLQRFYEGDLIDQKMEWLAQSIEVRLTSPDDSLRDRLGLGLDVIENKIWKEELRLDESNNSDSSSDSDEGDDDEDLVESDDEESYAAVNDRPFPSETLGDDVFERSRSDLQESQSNGSHLLSDDLGRPTLLMPSTTERESGRRPVIEIIRSEPSADIS